MSILKVQDLWVSFFGLMALTNLTFDIEEKSVVGLIGPNGAGKSTFFNVLSRLVNPQKGEILYKGESILKYRPYDMARKGIRRSFQTPAIFKSLTVLENLLVGAHLAFECGLAEYALHLPRACKEDRARRDEALSLLESLGLGRFADQKADSMPIVFQRRMEIGRTLMIKPSLLLLDEPTAGMIAEERENMVQFIREINERGGITIIVVEHDIKLIRKLCDHVIVLNFGEKIGDGTPEEVSRNANVIKAYLGEE